MFFQKSKKESEKLYTVVYHFDGENVSYTETATGGGLAMLSADPYIIIDSVKGGIK